MKAYNDWVTGKKRKNVTNFVCNKFYDFDPCFSVSILGYFKNAVVNILVYIPSRSQDPFLNAMLSMATSLVTETPLTPSIIIYKD